MAGQSRFLLDQPLATPGEYVLNRVESHHVAAVLRLREDDAIVVFDGRGNFAEAVIVQSGRDAVRVRVDGVTAEPHLPLNLTIATAIPKGKRWQILVEKCTELGVDRIIPLLTERGVVKGEGDSEKWRRWIVEAAKQSRRAWIPEILEPQNLPRTLSLARNENSFLFMADPRGAGSGTYRDALRNILNVMVLIGPEGGFTDAELDECRRQGARPLCLSPFTLRIETAAATVCAIIREVML